MGTQDDNFIDNIDRDIRRSKYDGIMWDKNASRYRVRMTGPVKWYGLFTSPEAARLAHKRIGGIFK